MATSNVSGVSPKASFWFSAGSATEIPLIPLVHLSSVIRSCGKTMAADMVTKPRWKYCTRSAGSANKSPPTTEASRPIAAAARKEYSCIPKKIAVT